MAAAVAAITVSLGLAACTSSSEGATDTGDESALIATANQIAFTTKDRLAVMPDVAYTKYQARIPVDDLAADKAQIAAFVEATDQAGVPAATATAVMSAQILAGKTVQRSLFRQWSTGVTPIPDGDPIPLAALNPQIAKADNDLAAGIRQLQSQGASDDWPDLLTAAADEAAKQLPASVTRTEFNDALGPIMRWPTPASKASASASAAASASASAEASKKAKASEKAKQKKDEN